MFVIKLLHVPVIHVTMVELVQMTNHHSLARVVLVMLVNAVK